MWFQYYTKQYMNHSSFTGTIRSNQGAGWQVGGGEGGASDPENADGGEGEGGAAAASGPEGGVLRRPEERDGGRSEEQGTGKCLLVIVGREEGDFGKGERDWGSNWAVLFVFWGWVFFLIYCNIVIRGITLMKWRQIQWMFTFLYT